MAASRMNLMTLVGMSMNSRIESARRRNYGDDGVGGLLPNDIALELGVATRGHVEVPGAVFADGEDVVLSRDGSVP
jgi:hypothetical protein